MNKFIYISLKFSFLLFNTVRKKGGVPKETHENSGLIVCDSLARTRFRL
jgi:hypothetical protein